MKAVPEGASTFYEIDVSPLRDFRGLPVGRLLLLHDVTEHRRSQELILDQQRVLATLTERERLGRELHDGFSQDLALINLQAQLVSGLLETGQKEQALAQLQVLAKAARDTQVDVRAEISKLAHSKAQGQDFLGAITHFTETFQQTYGIETEWVVPAAHQAISLTPAVEAQLLRIVQESFTNIRKHAGATRVTVSLKRENGCLELAIEDNGKGFDPQSLPAAGRSFGLGIMSARAGEVNGRLDVNSTPGKGTRVSVFIPVDGEG
jgi:signal transduction histidine kinase